jgi:hypothetical protein
MGFQYMSSNLRDDNKKVISDNVLIFKLLWFHIELSILNDFIINTQKLSASNSTFYQL